MDLFFVLGKFNINVNTSSNLETCAFSGACFLVARFPFITSSRVCMRSSLLAEWASAACDMTGRVTVLSCEPQLTRGKKISCHRALEKFRSHEIITFDCPCFPHQLAHSLHPQPAGSDCAYLQKPSSYPPSPSVPVKTVMRHQISPECVAHALARIDGVRHQESSCIQGR